MSIPWPDDSIFEPFDVSEHTYKTVDSVDIKAAVLIPKNIKPGPHPVFVNVHGGFFVTAHSLFAPFFPVWGIPLVLKNSAIIISADYRLLPSKNGIADSLEDVEDFWQWMKSDLPRVLKEIAPEHTLDFSKVTLAGGSAGGYFATQLALSHPDEINAAALIYPFVDPDDKLYHHGPAQGAPTILRFPIEEIPSVEEGLAWIEAESKKPAATKGGFERTPFAVSLCQYGHFSSKVFDSAHLNLTEFHPFKRIRAGAKMPPRVWILHGDDDSTVYVSESYQLKELVEANIPQTILRFDVVAGEDHAFDYFEDRWADIRPAAMDFIEKGWLKDGGEL